MKAFSIMDPSTASYFRALLFADGQAEKPLPPTLVKLYSWCVKRNGALGLGGMITKQLAFTIVLTWLSTTTEGREFAAHHTTLGDMFGEVPESDEPETEDPAVNVETWDTLPLESDVIVMMKSGIQKPGKFVGRRGNWVDVRIGGEVQHYRISKVKIAGV